ncbi:MAG: hypothetical protein O3C57_08275 [Verrucomicrobia bacterium]|nr:hypothetical protein [Verrucomicrobiota bacterium]
MSMFNENLFLMLKICAAVQIAVAILNLFLEPMLHWKRDIDGLPLLPRQVFRVHLWFISITLLVFGFLTWIFAAEFAAGSQSIGRGLAGGIALFWGIRTVIQLTYYSREHWWGKAPQTIVHIILVLAYGVLSTTYAYAAF